nr:MAG TPA: hypothetical protein [Caudoviricetes sp.]
MPLTHFYKFWVLWPSEFQTAFFIWRTKNANH